MTQALEVGGNAGTVGQMLRRERALGGRAGRLSIVVAIACFAIVTMIVLAGGVGIGAGDSATAAYEYGKKVTICHHADASNVVTITVSSSALDAHLAHGDTIGPCPPR